MGARYKFPFRTGVDTGTLEVQGLRNLSSSSVVFIFVLYNICL